MPSLPPPFVYFVFFVVPPSDRPMRRILILRGGALGDFLVTLPALAALRSAYPAARIELAGNAPAAALAVSRGLLDAAHSQHESRWAALYDSAPLPPTFAAWLAGRRRGSLPGPAKQRSDAPAFLLAEIGDASSGGALEVRLPGGAVARAAGPAQLRLLAELLRHLA